MKQVGPTGWFARYLDYLTVEKGLAPNTIEAYRADLARLDQSLGRRRVEQAGRDDLLRLMRQMRLAEDRVAPNRDADLLTIDAANC